MNFQSIFVGLVALVGSNSVALADLAGGPVFSPGVVNVRCMVFNAGPGNATITSHTIIRGSNGVNVLNIDSCGASLPPLRHCTIASLGATNSGTGPHSCRFVMTGGVVRGTIAEYGTGDQLLSSSDMR